MDNKMIILDIENFGLPNNHWVLSQASVPSLLEKQGNHEQLVIFSKDQFQLHG